MKRANSVHKELIVAQLVKYLLLFMKYDGSITMFTVPSSDTDESSPLLFSSFNIYYNIIFQSLPRSPNWFLSFRPVKVYFELKFKLKYFHNLSLQNAIKLFQKLEASVLQLLFL